MPTRVPGGEVFLAQDGAYVEILRGYLPPALATEMLNLLVRLDWHWGDITVREKTCPIPRGLYYCSHEDPKELWPPGVAQIRDAAERLTGISFDSCLLNFYPDGQSCIAPHADREALGPDNAVLTVSLGATRKCVFRTKGVKARDPGYRRMETRLHNGDLLLMHGRCQELYTHQIPREARVKEPRISLTYRCGLTYRGLR